MRKWFWIGLVIAVIMGFYHSLIPPKSIYTSQGYHIDQFATLPILHEGRIKPLDTVARATLISIRGKQSLRTETGTYSAIDWLITSIVDPYKANRLALFNLRDPSQYGLTHLGLESKQKVFSFYELIPYFDHIQTQAAPALDIEAKKRTPFQKNIVQLHHQLMLYFQLKNTFYPETVDDPSAWVHQFMDIKSTYQDQLLAHLTKPDGLNPDIQQMVLTFRDFQLMSDYAIGWVIPGKNPKDWTSMGTSLLTLFDKNTPINTVADDYLTLFSALHTQNPTLFNDTLNDLYTTLNTINPTLQKKLAFEVWFHNASLFYTTMTVYLLITIGVLMAWLSRSLKLQSLTVGALAGTFGVHTLALIIRMVLQGRPPVTNLYSTAVFIGWVAILLGLLLEKQFKNGIGTFCSGIIGFLTLIIAHHLSLTGDTLEMMQAVLDSNFWLATHVVVINIGYGAAILSAVLAHIYILGGFFTSALTKEMQSSLVKMTFATVAFALVANFVGTVLGGIWADQSWGRFWGWDPKENGALLIVIWLAIILHARLAGLIKQRGVMVLSVFTNVVTSFSWFGTNMLGVGLHSYGFMDKAFFWIVVFCLTQLTVMAIGSLPRKLWKSTPL